MFIKRPIDIILSLTGLLLCGPLVLLAALSIFLQDRHSPLFRQQRLGKDGRLFEILKLRSMKIHDSSQTVTTQVTDDHHLVTPMGRIVRRTKLDEMPQLINILKGQMTIIGPRPAPQEKLAGYDDFQRRRLEVRPGLTGWAQVNGNIEITWDERILLDVWYIDHWSPWLDIKILIKTFGVIFFGEHSNPKVLQEARQHANRLSGNA